MHREKKILLLAHCLLNCNAKIAGIAESSAAQASLLHAIMQDGIGIIQLPCPEMSYLGCKRWGMTREQYDTPMYRAHCRAQLSLLFQCLADYVANGCHIVGLVGIDGSPSCGVGRTCFGYAGGELSLAKALPTAHMGSGPGVFLEECLALAREHGLVLPVAAVEEEAPAGSTWPGLKATLERGAG